MKARGNGRDRRPIAEKARESVSVILVVLGMPLEVHANLAQNPSMEGSFVTQDTFGEVAEHWTAWEGEGWWGEDSLDAVFSEGDVAHDGGKSQRIAWAGLGDDTFGYHGLCQRVEGLVADELYRASFWFRGRMETSVALGGTAGFSIHGGIGTAQNGATDPSQATGWNEIMGQAHRTWASWPYTAWYNVTTYLSPTGSVATVFIRFWGHGSSWGYLEIPNPDGTWTRVPLAESWDVHCYADDVVVAPMAIGSGSSVEATSPVAANGVDRSEVTITVLDSDGVPLADIPPSAIVVGCTGTGNTIVGPASATDPNGQTTVYIGSRVAEAKTVSVTVFGRSLADTPVVEFIGSFGPIWYVDKDATGADYGSSWTDAFNDLQDALAAALPGDEIWVAEGTYTPGSVRTSTFQLKSGVALRGGYAGFGVPDPNVRNADTNRTILCGDLSGDDGADFTNNGENSYHVVTGSGTDQTAILDGFTIMAGNANGSSYLQNAGGGMLIDGGSPSLLNCTFTNNSGEYGGALENYNASPSLADCTFSLNHADVGGGGMANDANAAPTVTGCEFSDNSAEYGGGIRSHTSTGKIIDCAFYGNSAANGGGVFNHGNSIELQNCTFSNNSADWAGGGLMNSESTSTMTGCTFSGNSAVGGGGFYDYVGSLTATNCLFGGNKAQDGAGTHFEESHSTLMNCTFNANLADNGNAVACDSDEQVPVSDVVLANCILWNGANGIWNNDGSAIAATYSDIQGGWPGTGNMDADPCFVEPGYWDPAGTPGDTGDDLWVDGNYRLTAGSPCIDAGDPDYVAAPGEVDLGGASRVMGGRIDVGAYEFQISPWAVAGTVYADLAAPSTSGVSGVSIAAAGAAGTYETSSAGADGSWYVSNVVEGTYTITPSKAGYTFEHVADGTPDGQTSFVIAVNEANQTANQDIQFLAHGPPVRLHDWNGDGIVSIVGDVPPFVNCVYFQDCPADVDTVALGDCNSDGLISIVGDVPCFVNCVYFNNCPE